MKRTVIIIFAACLTGLAASEDAIESFLNYRPVSGSPFGVVRAQESADARRVAIYGSCGTCVLKEQRPGMWIFEVHVGYGGEKKPDILIAEPPPAAVKSDAFREAPNQTPLPTPELRTEAAGL